MNNQRAAWTWMVLLCATAAGCQAAPTGVLVTLEGAIGGADEFLATAYFGAASDRQTIANTAGANAPATFFAELAAKRTTVWFDIAAIASGQVIARGQSASVEVFPREVAEVRVMLVGDGTPPAFGSDGGAPGSDGGAPGSDGGTAPDMGSNPVLAPSCSPSTCAPIRCSPGGYGYLPGNPSFSVGHTAFVDETVTPAQLWIVGGWAPTGLVSTGYVAPLDGSNAFAWTETGGLARLHGAAVRGENGDRFCVVGGEMPENTPVATVSCLSSQGWQTRSTMSQPRGRHAAVRDEAGRIFAIGGTTALSPTGTASMEYLGADETWFTAPPMSITRIDHGAAIVGGRIYVIGGQGPGGILYNSAEVFTPGADPSTGTWASLPALPQAVARPAVLAGPDGAVYVVGGQTDRIYRYLPSDGQWRVAGTLTEGTSDVTAVFSPQGNLLLLGANTSNGFQQHVRMCAPVLTVTPSAYPVGMPAVTQTFSVKGVLFESFSTVEALWDGQLVGTATTDAQGANFAAPILFSITPSPGLHHLTIRDRASGFPMSYRYDWR